jgi:hypothetical protein
MCQRRLESRPAPVDAPFHKPCQAPTRNEGMIGPSRQNADAGPVHSSVVFLGEVAASTHLRVVWTIRSATLGMSSSRGRIGSRWRWAGVQPCLIHTTNVSGCGAWLTDAMARFGVCREQARSRSPFRESGQAALHVDLSIFSYWGVGDVGNEEAGGKDGRSGA